MLVLFSASAFAAEEPLGAWDMSFLWEGEEDDAPVTIVITEGEEGKLSGTATSKGRVLDSFSVEHEQGEIAFQINFAGAALIENRTYDFRGPLVGNSFEGEVLAEGFPFKIHVIGRRTSEDPTPKFTSAQAAAGEEAYQQHCALCHGADLRGLEQAPVLRGDRFDQTWRGQSLSVFTFHLRRMPPEGATEPGSVSHETRLDILAFLLASNGLSPGKAEMPSSMDDLHGLYIPKLPGVETDPDAPVVPSPAQVALLKNLPAVTDAMLQHPSDEDWLHWGGTASFHNFSPLNDINGNNVEILKPVWRTQLRNGRGNPAPLVHQGVMFLQTFPDRVLALDASNGDVLWRFQHEHNTRSTKKMGIALHGVTVIVPTSDMQLVALKAKTGEVVWKNKIAQDHSGFSLGSAPLVAGDKVIQGVMGFYVPGGPFIMALDIKTGKELWRFHTIARPGELGGNSWNDLPLEKRSGGNVWHQGTYDAELNLVYYGPTATYDLEPQRTRVDKEGVTNDALFTNTTLALNADTGELVWHFQHLRNDQWNFDWAYERQIVNMTIDGTNRKVLLNTGKMAITDALDAATGEYLFSMDAGVQNIVASIDPVSGVKTVKPESIPREGSTFLVSPNHYGARSWAPTSFNPQTNRLYVPLGEGAQIIDEHGWHDRFNPDSKDGTVGRIQAFDVASRELAWRFDSASPVISGVLATGGGLVFAADLNRTLRAHDDATGEVLWQHDLDDLPNSNIITYEAGGTQYVAIVVGLISDNAEDWEMTYRRFAPDEHLPINDAAKGGSAIWAFALD